MVISFTDDHVFDFLDSHGYVVTFRKNRRSSMHEETWVRRKRGECKEFDCYVTEIGKVVDPGQYRSQSTNPQLKDWVNVNGLPTDYVADWVDTIRSLNDNVPTEGYLYFVKKQEMNSSQSEL